MHASHAANSLRPSRCTTNLRHIHSPHTVSPRPPTLTLLRRALIRAHTCALPCSLLAVISPFPRLNVSTRDAQPFTALAISLAHSLRARRRHCTRPLAHPLAACSTTSLHSPTRSPTRCVLDDATALAHSLTHSLRARRRHCTHPFAFHSLRARRRHCTRPLAHPLAGNQTRRRLFGGVQRRSGRSRALVDYGERSDSDSSA